MTVAQCDLYLREKLTQMSTVVAERYANAVEGARVWARQHAPELVARCDYEAEEKLTALRNNGLFDEFQAAALDFCRAEIELYKAHAMFLKEAA